MKYFLPLSLLLPLAVFGTADPLRIDPAAARLEQANATASVAGGTLTIDFTPELEWPHAELHGKWDLSPYRELSAVFRNNGDSLIRLEWRISTPGGNWQKDSLTARIPLLPGEKKRVAIPLLRKASAKDAFQLHGMKSIPVEIPAQSGIDVSNVVKMEFILPRGNRPRSITVGSLTASGKFRPVNRSLLPLLDRFGQYRHADWPGKTKSLNELKAAAAAEARELEKNPAPAEWNRYGGWKNGPQLEATGAFRTARHGGRWTLVDPEGRLFFSIGMNHVNIGGVHSSTPLLRRNGWFEELPTPNEAVNWPFYFVRYIYSGDYSGNYSPGFSFVMHNLQLKYGKDWLRKAGELAPRRLKSWGFNTLANWSDPQLCAARQLPYTVGVALAGSGARVIGGGAWRVGSVWDVYDPKFPQHVDNCVRGAGKIAASPWCIGLFVDNELHWSADLAGIAFASGPEQPAKQALVRLLRQRYRNDLAALNRAWGTAFTGWEQLAAARKLPDPARAAADFDAFYTQTAETYFRTVRDSIRKQWPGRLYLGARLAQYTPLTWAAAARYCDVISLNHYSGNVDGIAVAEQFDAPVIATEFHFGATDRGMFGGGVVEVANQSERAASYRNYLESALKHPRFVGAHYFQYVDQPVTGRIFDGENYNIGFLDVADRPYPELVEAARAVADSMYRTRFGGEPK